jgi:gliding motility-associated lipoprotein GldB
MYHLKTPLIYLFFFISFLAISCSNRNDVDVSKVKLDLKVERFDQEMSALTPANVSANAPVLKQKYGAFYEDFMSGMINAGTTTDTAYYRNLRTILSVKDYNELKKDVSNTFADFTKTEAQLTDAFKHVRYYYPKQKIPRLITFYSGFAYQSPIGDDYIGIGLDMFLGANSRFYPALRESIPYYLSRRFTPENITPRTLEVFTRENLFPEQDADRSLLSKMIYGGKIYYFMNAMMPETADSLIIGYTAKQLEWSKENESNIWAYFLDENLLYETDYMKIQQYLTEAPFTPGIGEKNDSSPKLALWAGWQLVKKYMDKNPGVTLQQLMKDIDYQQILTKSKYKPK